MSIKDAATGHPITEEIRTRWSPRAFADTPVPQEALSSLFEAARWAPSCYNTQPWRFMVATKDQPEHYDALLQCLMAKNREWAASAPVLVLSMACADFENGKPNRHALHDVGQAVAQMTIQARALGLYVHQMAGFSQKKAREAFGIPEDFIPTAAIAIGFAGDPETLGDDFREMETARRTRHELSDLVFTGTFGQTSPLVLK